MTNINSPCLNPSIPRTEFLSPKTKILAHQDKKGSTLALTIISKLHTECSYNTANVVILDKSFLQLDMTSSLKEQHDFF